MLLPSILNDNFMDSVLNDIFSVPIAFAAPSSRWMNTNIKDSGTDYQLEMELPGYEKKDIHAELKDGYLTISADRQETKDESDENGRYVRRERYNGSCKRSFYVGETLRENDFHASFDNGVLKLTFPKDTGRAKLEEKKYIAIE